MAKVAAGRQAGSSGSQHPISSSICANTLRACTKGEKRCQINLAFVAGGGFKLSAANRPLDSSPVLCPRRAHQRRECTISALSLALALHLHGDRCFCRRAGRVHETGSSLAALLAADQYAGRLPACGKITSWLLSRTLPSLAPANWTLLHLSSSPAAAAATANMLQNSLRDVRTFSH